MPRTTLRLLLAASILVAPGVAMAHPGHGAELGLSAGLAHPWSGIDHVLAMTAVGLLAARLGGRALWAVPAAFLGLMALGGIGDRRRPVIAVRRSRDRALGGGVRFHDRVPARSAGSRRDGAGRESLPCSTAMSTPAKCRRTLPRSPTGRVSWRRPRCCTGSASGSGWSSATAIRCCSGVRFASPVSRSDWSAPDWCSAPSRLALVRTAARGDRPPPTRFAPRLASAKSTTRRTDAALRLGPAPVGDGEQGGRSQRHEHRRPPRQLWEETQKTFCSVRAFPVLT